MENQLTLFTVLSDKQEQIKLDFIKTQEESTNSRLNTNKIKCNLLKDGGFIEGEHFIDTFKTKSVTKEVELGYSWKGNKFKTEVTYQTYIGACSIKLKSISKDNTLEDTTYQVYLRDGKLECSFTEQYRGYKPSTLFKKHLEYNEGKVLELQRRINKANVKEYTLAKYKKLYPNAEIKLSTRYERGYGNSYRSGTEYNTLEITFPSKSTIQFTLSSEIDKEWISKSYDYNFKMLSTEEKLQYFNNQPQNKD